MKKFVFISFAVLLIWPIAYIVHSPMVPITLDGKDLWQGGWASEKTGKAGGFECTMVRDGETFSGMVAVTGSPITKGGEISGTIKGDEIQFGFAKDKRGMLKYVGKISKNTMSGTWEIPIIKDHGTWQAKKD